MDYTVAFERDRPDRPSSVAWTTVGGGTAETHQESFVYGADGRLTTKVVASDDPTVVASLGMHAVDYRYDGLGRVQRVQSRSVVGFNPDNSPIEEPRVESEYTYDLHGVVTHLDQLLLEPGSDPFSLSLTYEPGGPFHTTTGRSQLGPMGELIFQDAYVHDSQSRVQAMFRTFGGVPGGGDTGDTDDTGGGGGGYVDAVRYLYDGTGQLAGMVGAEGTPEFPPDFTTVAYEVAYFHDLDDTPVARLLDDDELTPGTHPRPELWFQGWKLDEHLTFEGGSPPSANGLGGPYRELEHILPFLDLVHDPVTGWTSPQWLLREPDGHVWAQLDDAGLLASAQLVGAYGMPMGSHGATALTTNGGLFATDLRNQYGLHGAEADQLGGFRMGVRNVADSADGMWLQPEPLLHLGPGAEQLADPRGMVGAYARGVTTTHSDRSGYCVDGMSTVACVAVALWGAAEVAMTAADVAATIDTAAGVWRGEDSLGALAFQGAMLGIGVVLPGGGAGGATRFGDEAVELLSKGADDVPLATVADDLPGACFVAGTGVFGPSDSASIEDLAPGALVLAAKEHPSAGTVEQLHVPRTAWRTRAGEHLRRATLRLALPATLLAACDIGTPPSDGQTVTAYQSDTATWLPSHAGDVAQGGEAVHDGHLFRRSTQGWDDLGSLGPNALADADAAVTEINAVRQPGRDTWVLVLGIGRDNARHAKVAELAPGDRFAFQGRVFVAQGIDEAEVLRETSEVLGRVVNTFVRTANAVVAVELGFADGKRDTITGTPNHPFWVPSVQDYVALEDLAVGTVLRTSGGSEATVLGLTWKPGEVEVFNLEVEGVHNYFARGADSDEAGVLVHNGCGDDVVETVTHTRQTPGADGGQSSHILEKVDGDTTSVTHRVEVEGELVHQHQHHVGKAGGEREFPEEWTGTKRINADPHPTKPAPDNSITDK